MYDSINYPNFTQPQTVLSRVDLTAKIVTAIADDYCDQLPSDTKFLDEIVLRAAQSPLGEDDYLHLAQVAMRRVGRRDLADEIRFYRAEVL